MKILFYLPVVTPWWFDKIVVHLIRACARDAAVHVIVPPLWQGTGIGPDQLASCADLDQVAWYIWDSETHPAIRTSAVADADLLSLIKEIDADYTICRSADVETPKLFPGKVRFLMEGNVPMMPCPREWVTLPERVLDAGMIGDISADDRQVLEQDVAPLWELVDAHVRKRADAGGRVDFCERAGIASDKHIIAMPLEYEHRENFFTMHRRYESNAEFVQEIAEKLDDRFVLAVTDHPLNLLHGRSRAVKKLARKSDGRVVIVPDLDGPRTATESLLAYSDGVVLGDTKSITVAAYFGISIYRRSNFASAPWLHAYEDFDRFIEAVLAGTAKTAGAADTKLWLAYHIANNVLDLEDDSLTAADVIDYFERPMSKARWQTGPERFNMLVTAMKRAA